MDFFPKNYSQPKAESNYLKLVEGENTFRILSPMITGWEGWKTQDDKTKKPVRCKQDESINIDEIDDPDEIRFFWAFICWNCVDKKIQIFEIRQRTIQKSLGAIIRKWGSPDAYDITIEMEKTGALPKDVKYTVIPNPATKLDESIKKVYEDIEIDLEKLYVGEDPYIKNDKKTPQIANKEQINTKEEVEEEIDISDINL